MIGELIPSSFHYIAQSHFTELFPFIQSMTGIRDDDVSSIWQDVLIKAIQFINIETLKTDVLEFATSKGNLYESEKNRVFCCQLFGAFSTRFKAYVQFIV
jgi:hypothetical protein